MQPNGVGSPDKKGMSKQSVIIAVLAVLMLAVVAVGIYVILGLLNREPEVIVQEIEREVEVEAAIGAGAFVVDESNLDTIVDDLITQVDDGMFLVSMNTVWVFPDGKTATSNFHLENSESNSRPVVAVITLDETDEVIYTSGIIPPGSRLRTMVLDRELPPGQHPATCTYNLLDPDGEIFSQLACAVTLVVE